SKCAYALRLSCKEFFRCLPTHWQQGEDVVIVPSLKDEEEIKQRFPKGYTAVKPYLRLTPQPESNKTD
ncbi:hypothetical protein ACFMKD_23690, partial [Acinetobacter baumannii]